MDFYIHVENTTRGEVLAFTDADCIPDRNWIRAGVAALASGERRCIVGGEVVFSRSQRPTAIERYQYLTGFMQQENIERRGFTATANLFARALWELPGYKLF